MLIVINMVIRIRVILNIKITQIPTFLNSIPLLTIPPVNLVKHVQQ